MKIGQHVKLKRHLYIRLHNDPDKGQICIPPGTLALVAGLTTYAGHTSEEITRLWLRFHIEPQIPKGLKQGISYIDVEVLPEDVEMRLNEM